MSTLTPEDIKAIAAELQEQWGGRVVKRQPSPRTPEQKAALVKLFKESHRRCASLQQAQSGCSATPCLGKCHKSCLGLHKCPECTRAYLQQGAEPVSQKLPAARGLKPVGMRLAAAVRRFLSVIFQRRA